MMPVFADAYFYLALINSKDAGHSRAVSYARAPVRPIITTSWVLLELADGLAKARTRSHFSTLQALILQDPNTSVILAEQDWMDRGLMLFLARPDKEWSLTDCISFLVMQDRGLTDALTADHHFEQAGYSILLK